MEVGAPKIDNVTCCLICNTSFDGTPVLLATSEENDGINGEENQETKAVHSAFILFCKLLLLKGNEENDVCIQLLGEMFENLLHPGGGSQLGEMRKRSPFCKQCFQGIGEVRKLEVVINETKMLQKCILDDLKTSLISSQSSLEGGDLATRSRGNRVRVAIRRQLIINMGSEEIPTETSNSRAPFEQRIQAEVGPVDKCKSKESDEVKNQKTSSRKGLKRGLNLEEASDPPPPANKMLSLPTSADFMVDAREIRSPSESEVLEEVQDSNSNSSSNSNNDSDWHEESVMMMMMMTSVSEDEEMSASKPSPKKGGRVRSKVSTRKRRKSSASHVEDSARPRKRKRDLPKPAATGRLLRSRLQARGSRQVKLADQSSYSEGEGSKTGIETRKSVAKMKGTSYWYWIIPNKNLLMLVHSLIKYDYMERLECLERGCGHVVEGTSASSFENMRQHVLVRHPQYSCGRRTSRKCPFCGERVYWLKSHINANHPDLPELQILCEICWKPLKSKTPRSHLLSHKSEEEQAALTAQKPTRAETASRTVECNECGRKFLAQNHLLWHAKTHRKSANPASIPKPKKEKPIQCLLCPSIFPSSGNLKSHMYSQHNGLVGNELSCPICDKKFHFYRKKHFQDHYRTHTNEKPFVCEICGKAFTSEDYLKSHSTAHTSDKQFQCQFCGVEFKYKRGMKQHCRLRHPEMSKKSSDVEKTIAGRVPIPTSQDDFIGPKQMFPCDFCEKVFQWRCRMKKHMRLSHSQEFSNFDAGEGIGGIQSGKE